MTAALLIVGIIILGCAYVVIVDGIRERRRRHWAEVSEELDRRGGRIAA